MIERTRRLAFLALVFPLSVSAATLTEDFSTADHFSATSTAVWNLADHRGHLPYFADTNGVGTNTAIHIGTGKDGVFDSTTSAKWDTNAGADPTLVTLDTSRTYEFTTFTLDPGVTLKASGAAPLLIRVQGDASVAGTIHLSGRPGSDLSADTSQNPSGGISGPGGGSGGRGGATGIGANGTSADAGSLGSGKAGSLSGGKGGGGGGAGYDTAGAAGAGGGAGVAGGNYGDTLLASFLGGSGGGGGGPGINASGGGGGGGGGALSMEVGGALHVVSGGRLDCQGGAGGGTLDGSLKGGGGGGGSGGAILLLSGGAFTNDGLVRAMGGAGGSVTLGGAGGTGQKGRTRIVNIVDNSYGGAGSETPVPNLANLGKVAFDTTGPFTLVSSGYDTKNSGPTYESVAISVTTPGATTAAVEVAGSSDNFVSDDTGFVAATALTTLAGKRFVRFRLTLQSSNGTLTPSVRSVTVTYTPREQGTFKFGVTGCARVSPSNTSSPWGFLAWVVFLISLPTLGKRRRGRQLPERPKSPD